MLNWNDTEIQIDIADSHRVANLIAICEELLAPKSDRARRSRRAGSEFQDIRRIFAPSGCRGRCPQRQNLRGISAGDSGHHRSRLADFQRCVALLIADRLLQGKNNQPLAQTSDQNRRPIFVVSDLDRDDASGAEHVDLSLEIARAFFDVGKFSQDLAARVEDCG